MDCHLLIQYCSWDREWARKLKRGKSAGPSVIVVEMQMASRETGIDLVMELANLIVSEGVTFNGEVTSVVNRGRGMVMLSYK